MKFILWIWQLPQNLIGLLVILFSRAKLKGTGIYESKSLFNSGVSLGNYIIFQENCYNEIDIKHEKGHQVQGKYYGPFYLLIIGIPSLIGNILYRIKKFNYYNQPWEKQADKLGGVVRN